MLFAEVSSERRLFRHFWKDLFWSFQFRKYISYESHPFLENVQNLISILKMQKTIGKMFFVFEIIASELAPLNCLY